MLIGLRSYVMFGFWLCGVWFRIWFLELKSLHSDLTLFLKELDLKHHLPSESWDKLLVLASLVMLFCWEESIVGDIWQVSDKPVRVGVYLVVSVYCIVVFFYCLVECYSPPFFLIFFSFFWGGVFALKVVLWIELIYVMHDCVLIRQLNIDWF